MYRVCSTGNLPSSLEFEARILTNGKEVEVVLDSGASVPIVNKSMVGQSKSSKGKEIQVYDWKNEPTTLNMWSMVHLELGPFKGRVA